MQKRKSTRTNYQSVDSRKDSNTSKLVIEYIGTPLQVLQRQKDLEYKMRALNANERNVFKYNQAYWQKQLDVSDSFGGLGGFKTPSNYFFAN